MIALVYTLTRDPALALSLGLACYVLLFIGAIWWRA